MDKNESFELIESLGIIGRSEQGYTKQLILARWFNKPPMYEIRTFGPDGTPKKRAGLTPDELETLKELLADI